MSPRVLDSSKLQERELEIILAALNFAEQESVHTLTMDKLAARLPYSKGTLYNHFHGKEDLLLGVCNHSMAVLHDLFQRASRLEQDSRSKISACLLGYLLYAIESPVRFKLVLDAKNHGFAEQVSAERFEEHKRLDLEIFGMVLQIIEEAIERGEMTPPNGVTPPQIAFAGWATGFGSIALLLAEDCLCGGRSEMVLPREMFTNISIMLDGLQWQPLHNERHFAPICEALIETEFADEYQRVRAKVGDLKFS